MYVKRNIEARSCKYCCSGKALSISQSECICSLRCPACTAHAPYCHLWPVPLYSIFPHYLTNGTIFDKKKFLNIKCVFWVSLQLLSETFLMPRINMIKKYIYRSSLKAVYFFLFQWNLNFIDGFVNNTQISNFMKSRPVGAELFHADRRTDMTQLIVAFRNFANAPEKLCVQLSQYITSC